MSAFIDEHRAYFGVEPICQTFDVSASAYYQRATGERSERSVEDERLCARIRGVHAENFECYAYLRVWHELRRQGEQVRRDRVARLMRQEGDQGREAAREAVADHDRRSQGAQAPRPRARTRVPGAPRARVRTVSGSGRPNSD